MDATVRPLELQAIPWMGQTAHFTGLPVGCYPKLSLYDVQQRHAVDFYDLLPSKGILFRTLVRLHANDPEGTLRRRRGRW